MLSILNSLTADNPTVFEEMWQFLLDKYFSVNFEEYNYEHIKLTSNTFFSARWIIIALFLGVIAASAMSLFQKRTLGDLVRALDRESCYDADRAKTLEDLGLLRNSAVKDALRRGTVYSRTIHCVEEERFLAEQAEKRAAFEAEQAEGDKKPGRKRWKEIPYKYDFGSDHFYIPEDKAFGAISLFNKKGTNPLTFVATVVICVALMMLCCFLLPEMLQLADNFIGVFRNG